MIRPGLMGLAALAAVASGCAAYYTHYEGSAEREIHEILDSKKAEAVDRWQSNTQMPAPEKPAKLPSAEGLKVLSLADALRIATQRNRDFKSQVETTHLAALSLALQRHNFGPVISNTISYVYANSPSDTADGTGSAKFGVSDVIGSGGTVSASTTGGIDDDYEGGGPSTYSHDVTVAFEQPLLKGFGHEVAFENLTQAERNVVYALREFELFRQDFAIQVLRKYYAIVRQKQVVENSRRTFEQFVFLRRRSEALFEISKVSAIDKFRAKQEELTASNNLLTEEETLAALLDEFKVFLNLPSETVIDIEKTRPEVKAANIDLKSAIAAALHNHLELKTAVQRLEDAERAVRNAANGLLPDLDLSASFSLAGSRTGGESTFYSDGSHSAGLTLSLPLDKVADRNTYKAAIIERHRRKRALTLARDNVRLDVLNTYRRLRRLANSVRIERANVELAERRVANAKVRFEAGELGNRDVVEAQSAQLRAQNGLIRVILDYDVARLQLKRDIGILFIGPEGMWKPKP